jgi:hypothetical protein
MDRHLRIGAALSTLLWLLSSTAQAEEPGLLIAEGGQPRCAIAVGAEASPAERTAARELQGFLREVTGAELPIRPCTDLPRDEPQIVVGPSARLSELLPALKLDQIGDDGIVMRTVGKALVLAGPRPRGTLYAVYTFLEDRVGCRWWSSTESTIPKTPTLKIHPLDVTYAPKLKSRTAFYRDALKSPFAVRLKLNGSAVRADETLGGTNRFALFVHTFFPLLPPKTYFEKHPEWYSLIDGKRVHERAQLCLTNDAMREELTRNALEVLRKNPGARLISISQNDWHNPCQCEKCRAVVGEEGSEAGPLLRFVNAVAADIEKEFPKVWVETLAYQYTRQAPKLVRPRNNVVVRLCSIECSFVEPLGGEKYGGGAQNEAFRKDIEAWSRIAPRLFVWDYVTNFHNYVLPHPNLHALAPNVRFFIDRNVVGLFEQGDSQSGIGDFVVLRAWLLAHLMWNPALDEGKLIDEFLAGYYGPAAPHLRAYLDFINHTGRRSGKYIRCYMPDTSAWMGLDELNRATALYRQAEAAVADNPSFAARVRRERLPLDHEWLSRYGSLKTAARLQGKPFAGPADPRAACEEYLRVCRENGAGNWREGFPFDERAEALRGMFGPPAKLPKQAEGLEDARWVDMQDGQFRLHTRDGWAKRVEDPAASDGRAACMPGDHHEWALSLPFSADWKAGNPWRVYMAARVEATANDGRAMTMGIYDPVRKKPVISQTLTVEQVAGKEYRIFDLGSHDLDEQMYFWAAPPKRPGEVQNVYVDRVFLVREQPKDVK